MLAVALLGRLLLLLWLLPSGAGAQASLQLVDDSGGGVIGPDGGSRPHSLRLHCRQGRGMAGAAV